MRGWEGGQGLVLEGTCNGTLRSFCIGLGPVHAPGQGGSDPLSSALGSQFGWGVKSRCKRGSLKIS